ncbi:MAG: YitT family protein, partial [Spirochaetia bacterium]
MNAKSVLQIIREYFFITFGCFLLAFGWNAFLIPSNVIGGGLSGVGSLVFFSTGIPVGITLLVLNIALLGLAVWILGAQFGIRSVWGIVAVSTFMYILQQVFHDPLVDDVFMATLIGAILSGAGVGMTFANEGSSGGTDIIVMIITKYWNFSPGRVMLYLDIVIITSSYFLFQSVEIIIYGYVMMAVSTYTVDMLLDGARMSIQVLCFSWKNQT